MCLQNIRFALNFKKTNNMKSLVILFLITLSTLKLNAQVGINTVSPTKDLDINGELRVRDLPLQNTANIFLVTTDSNGNIGKSKTPLLVEVSSQVATNNVDITLNGSQIINNINLGLSTSVTIPANKVAFIIITYSVPVGVGGTPTGYYGIRFLKDGIESESGSRKFSIGLDTNVVNMVTTTNIFTENFTSEPVDRTITYSLNGYIEQYDNGTHTYRFNMYSSTSSNFNWGKATITKQVFIE
jgi:hypothetical protein